MNIFITGANGYIGSHLARLLIDRGHVVTCLVRDPAKAGSLRTLGASLAQGDITDRESMRAPMRGAGAVIHLAGLYVVGRVDTEAMHRVNVVGARNTLELAAELGVPRILHTSSAAVFGNTRGRIVDETYRVPKEALRTEYERTKWEAHYEVAAPLQAQGAPLIILQPGITTGPADQAPHHLLYDYFLARTPMMIGPNSGACFTHVGDVAEGFALALERGQPGEAYILCGQAITYRRLFELCSQITGIPATRLWAPGWIAAGLSKALRGFEALRLHLPFTSEEVISLDNYTYWCRADKAGRELGWTARPHEETFREVMHYELMKRGKRRVENRAGA